LNQFFQKEIIEDNIALYTTIAGFFLNELKRIPQIGDTIQHDNLILEIIDLAGAHMTSIGGSKNLVSKIRSFSHTELNVFPFNNRTFLGTLILLGICFDGSEVLKLNRSNSLVNGFYCQKKHRFDCLRVRFATILTPFVCRLYNRRIGSLSAPN
jgi:hypothetical protein